MSIFRQLSALLLFTGLASTVVFGQSYVTDMARQSARSDIRTGGTIEKSELEPNDPDVTLTVNVPSFDMTLWQSGKEINKYYVGIGLKDFPIFVGLRRIDTVIWNPAWIPPSSKWVDPSLHGKYIGPADPRNPLGKIKIPL
ncbi:MAG: L,D-transpeptidase family protein, partial [Acidobacteriota bacterium]|nr:L,D-transpeptidase family protein [Acidobacteriota bacterium]